MRILSLWLVALGMASATTAFAQRTIIPIQTNVKALQKIASAAEKDYKANRSKALQLARKHGWVVEKTYEDGTRISLQGLDATGLPIYYITYNNTRAAATTKTDQLWVGGSLGLNLSGASNSVAGKLAIWDGGRIRATHQELAGHVTQKDKASTDNEHATHVAGTMVARGINPQAKGMAYGLSNLLAYDFDGDAAEMAAAAKDLLVSNHSYGSIAGWRFNSERKGTAEDPYWEWWGNTEISETEDYSFGYYNGTAASWDEIAYNAPYYLMVKSAGNNRNENGPEVGKPYFQRNSKGAFTLVSSRPANMSSNNSYDVISTAGTAKNVLTVGAVAPISEGYNRPEDVQISSFSSFGPTDDGRIKPDIVGNGVAVLSTTSDSDRSYKVLNGTSMSAPNVSGTLLLLQEHYANVNRGNVMRAATLKGLVLHTADEAGISKGPDYVYGWGLLNAERAARMISNTNGTHLIQENTLSEDQTYTLKVIASGAGPLEVTISWTDPKGNVLSASAALNNRSPRLINDLDVRVSNRGTTYLPWTLAPEKPDAAAKAGDNIRDNVEKILIEHAVPGQEYTITVKHKGTLSKGPQAYSLLVSGVGGTAVCASAPGSEAGAKITAFGIGTQNKTFDAGCTTYQDLTSTIFELEPGQSKALTLTAGSCGADAATVAKVFADWNGDGDFEDSNETVATSGVLQGAAPFTGTIQAPTTAIAGNKVRLRVVLQETENAASVTACGSYARGETQDYLLQFTQPQKDISVTAISPVGGSILCTSPAQAVTATIRNNGTAAQRNIPVTISVRENGEEVAQLKGTYNGVLAPYTKADLLLEGSFATEAGKTYELVALSSLQGDAVSDNNRMQRSFTIAEALAPPTHVSAARCGTDPMYTLSGTGEGTVFWYNSATSTQPLAAGNLQQISASAVHDKIYAAYNDLEATIGAPNKGFATGGGYNQFSPDVHISTKAPVILQTARLYIGNGGKITFTAYNENGAPVSERTLVVTPTRSNPAPGVQPDDPTDEGAVYYLGLELPEAGNYRIAISYENGATIFRNNTGVKGYPFEVPNVVSITGNSATTTPMEYYYYFYDLKVSALGCKSERVEVPMKTGNPLPKPVVSRDGTELVSSAAEGNQWYLDGKAIADATGSTYTPTVSGTYTVIVLKDGCISDVSTAFSFDLETASRDVSADLLAFPNPSGDGRFTVTLETDGPEEILFDVVDMLGKTVYTAEVSRYNGQYKGELDLSSKSSGLYILRARHGDSVQTSKLLIRK
ncbi:putative secreted protein (Por secretion system target) [Pontibacter ummariensis]|uniref:Por secretion system C-terminal sorting domain-containing protein n=1 Tax=Pontibacter ummariensis TaxID=1610492 RepID=A0A239H0S6_9BACT|nr:S8 family serine peptidase [Pontibacter ummariensis]PRY10943.1 putative secreted protein (Por secretion system target) [Pontibacter ummariensis]SNS74782.1 Por secretion system C-terminal sorting domain-containing protein [Pontibacter ummariensis]